MAQQSGTKTRTKKAQDPVPLKQIELVCRVTGKSFHGYEGTLPVSNEGWNQLSNEQKWMLNNGASIEEVL